MNYTTADLKPISYGVREITAAVHYFYDHAEEYHVNPEEIYMIGYSAGAYYAAEAARDLKKEDCHLKGLILCYPWTTGLSNENFGSDWPQTLFILAGQDPISQKAKNYISGMEDAGLKPDVKEYKDAQHSFIESNNPEGMNDPVCLAMLSYVKKEMNAETINISYIWSIGICLIIAIIICLFTKGLKGKIISGTILGIFGIICTNRVAYALYYVMMVTAFLSNTWKYIISIALIGICSMIAILWMNTYLTGQKTLQINKKSS